VPDGEDESELLGVGVPVAEPAEPVQRRVDGKPHGQLRRRWTPVQNNAPSPCGHAQEEKVLHRLIMTLWPVQFLGERVHGL